MTKINISLKQQLAETLNRDEDLADLVVGQVGFWLENLFCYLDFHHIARPNLYDLPEGILTGWFVDEREAKKLPRQWWIVPKGQPTNTSDDEIPF